MHSLWHIHKRASRPDRSVKSRKLMVMGRHQLHKILSHHVGIFPLHGAFHIQVNHALCGNLLPHIVINKLGIILCPYPGKRLSFCLGDPQSFKGILNILGHIFPVIFHVGVGPHIGGNMVNIQSLQRRPPVRHRHFLIDLQRLQPELLHPGRVFLFPGKLFDDLRCQPAFHTICIIFLITDIIDAAVDILYHTLFLHSHARLSDSFPNPFLLISSTSSAPPFLVITPFSIT